MYIYSAWGFDLYGVVIPNFFFLLLSFIMLPDIEFSSYYHYSRYLSH